MGLVGLVGDVFMAKIDNKERISSLQENQYKELLGVDKPTFDKMYIANVFEKDVVRLRHHSHNSSNYAHVLGRITHIDNHFAKRAWLVFLKCVSYSILLDAHAQLHKQGGKPPILTVLDKLVITLGYWREYRTYLNIAFDYSITKTTIGKSVIRVEDTL